MSEVGSVLELLHPMIRRLWVEKGFGEPTPPQREAIPLVLSGENVLIVAPTGSGKTEAALLPILSRMLEEEGPGVRLLYITPLRTLNRDILARVEWWALKLGFRVGVRHGDTTPAERRVQSLTPPDILITTPESLQLLLVGRRLRNHLANVRWVIVDEVHEVADSKRGVQLSLLMERVKRVAGRLQVIGLSASVGNPEEVARLLVGAHGSCRVVVVPAHKRVRVSVEWPHPGEGDAELADRILAAPDVAARLRFVRELVESRRSTLIFTNTRPTAELLASRFKLWDERIPIYVHHGSLSRAERVRVEEMLRRGEVKGVVCTSSMELGIDIGHVDLVVQYNSPREVRRLLQRVGRAGHSLDRVSEGVVVVGNSDDALESIVLKRRMEQGFIEPSEIPRKPYDVLAHELVGLAMSEPVTLEEAYQLVRGAEPYRDLEREELERVAEFLRSIGLIRVYGDRLRPAGRRCYDYFYGALTTIPEVEQYVVVERPTGEPIGVLDDYFVAEYCEIGARFIMAGRPWEVVALTEEVVYVEPVEDFESAVPSWVGEEIPVPHEVALEVGRIRGLAAEEAERGVPLEVLAQKLAESYGVDRSLFERALAPVYEMVRLGLPVPSDRLIVVEEAGEGVMVVHAHYGNRVNRALGKYLAYRLARRLGLPAYSAEKPYRIVLRCENVTAEEVVEILRETDAETFLRYLRAAVEESRAFRWRLQQVARRMGVLAPGARLTRGDLERLVGALKGTPAYEEAMKEVLQRDMDVDRALAVVAAVRSGEIRVVAVRGPSPLTLEAERSLREGLEPAMPEKRELISYALFKVKVLQSFASFYCTECGSIFELPISELGEGVVCPNCGSGRLAFDAVPEEEMAARVERCARKGGCRRLTLSASLFERYGAAAVLARAAGLSFREVKEVLAGFHGGREQLLKLLWAKHREKVRSMLARAAQGAGLRGSQRRR
ncbi:MAG: DEAD/DEAH box helicase [Thermofilaceae archaeon]